MEWSQKENYSMHLMAFHYLGSYKNHFLWDDRQVGLLWDAVHWEDLIWDGKHPDNNIHPDDSCRIIQFWILDNQPKMCLGAKLSSTFNRCVSLWYFTCLFGTRT